MNCLEIVSLILKTMLNVIYLDNNSTTPIDPKVLDAMMPFFKEQFANASSSHFLGMQVNKAIENARYQVAQIINAEPKQIVFTSGATESINLVLKSFINHANTKKHIITLQTEHKAVLDTCRYLESIGFEITYLPVLESGLLDLSTLKNAIRQDTLLINVMWVNNETGVIQDIQAISNICKNTGILFMTDATQAVGKIPVDVLDVEIDFLVFSGHKFYGPKGIGALYYSKQAKHYLNSLIHGGGHEKGLRSGSLNVPAIIGLGAASSIVLEELTINENRVRLLRNKLEASLLTIKNSFVNGNKDKRIFNVSNICFPNLNSDVLIGKLKNIAISNGSSCTSAVIEPSHVLLAMGVNTDNANSSIRFSLGKFNTDKEIDIAIVELNSVINEMI